MADTPNFFQKAINDPLTWIGAVLGGGALLFVGGESGILMGLLGAVLSGAAIAVISHLASPSTNVTPDPQVVPSRTPENTSTVNQASSTSIVENKEEAVTKKMMTEIVDKISKIESVKPVTAKDVVAKMPYAKAEKLDFRGTSIMGNVVDQKSIDFAHKKNDRGEWTRDNVYMEGDIPENVSVRLAQNDILVARFDALKFEDGKPKTIKIEMMSGEKQARFGLAVPKDSDYDAVYNADKQTVTVTVTKKGNVKAETVILKGTAGLADGLLDPNHILIAEHDANAGTIDSRTGKKTGTLDHGTSVATIESGRNKLTELRADAERKELAKAFDLDKSGKLDNNELNAAFGVIKGDQKLKNKFAISGEVNIENVKEALQKSEMIFDTTLPNTTTVVPNGGSSRNTSTAEKPAR